MTRENKEALLYFHCHRPLHNGSGTSIGLIDRPIIRERISNLPFLQASSIKGVLRADAANANNADSISLVFGDDNPGGSKHQGCLDIDDASLLVLPVRSLKGGFVWVTCDLLLMRLLRTVTDLDLKGYEALDDLIKVALELGQDEILVAKNGKDRLAVDADGDAFVFLEEHGYRPRLDEGALCKVAEKIAGVAIKGEHFQSAFAQRLCVLPRDSLLYFAEHATEVQANIKIELATGTTKDGSLRYTEYLPQESILIGRVTARTPTVPAEVRDAGKLGLETAVKVLDFFKSTSLEQHHRFGADQTTGKGITYLRGEV
jgi:CRISPR-associated protein Cmr4